MNLDGLKTLEIVLGEAKTTTDCDITASYADSYVTDFILGENDLVSNGTTAVTVASAPPFNYQRQVKEVRLHNNDTVQHQVTLRLNNSGTFRIMETASVAPGGDFLYTPDAPAVVSTGAPALLLESGATGAKISALSAASTLVGTELVPLVQAGADVRSTVAGVLNYGHMISVADIVITASGAGTFFGGSAATVNTDSAYVNVASGNATGSGNTAEADFGTGAANSGNSGPAFFYTGDSTTGNTGDATVTSGNAPAGTSGGAGLQTAAGKSSGGVTNATGAASAGNSGTIVIVTGTAAGGGHVSGNISLHTGAPSGGATQGIIQIGGTTTNDSAASGDVGEYLETNTAGTALVTGTAKDVATRSLTAGDWDVWGSIVFHPAAGTTTSRIAGSIGTTANTLGTAPNSGAMFDESVTLAASTDETRPAGMRRLSLSAPTTVSLTALAAFAVSTMTADGFIGARRRR